MAPPTDSEKETAGICLAFSGSFCGGAERLMLDLRSLLESHSFSTSLILSGSGAVSDSVIAASPTVIAKPRYLDKHRPWNYATHFLRALRILLKQKPELLVIEGKEFAQVYLPAARLLRVNTLVYVHYPPSEYEVKRIPYQLASSIVLCAEGLRRYFPERLQNQIRAIQNYCDTDYFSPVEPEQKQNIQQNIFQLEDGETPLCVLLVGHLSEVKGQKELLKAAERLKQRGIPMKLAFAGQDNSTDGRHERMLRERTGQLDLEGEVIFLGQRKDTRELYQACDVFALPSFTEGMPLVLLEAMACGLPVVASRVDGNPELIENGEKRSADRSWKCRPA